MCVCVQGECHYEQELLPYLHKADAVGNSKNGQKKQRSTKTCAKTTNNKPKPSHSALSDLECNGEEAEREKTQTTSLVSKVAVTKQRPPAEHDTEGPYDDFTDHPGPEAICPRPSKNDCPEADMDDDCVIINEDAVESERAATETVNSDTVSQRIPKIDEDEDVEVQAMFYLPKQDSALPLSSPKLLPGRDESLKVILANVAELLSRSPVSPTSDLEADMTAPSLPPSPQRLHEPFQVSFTLGVDDDDDDDDEVMISDADDAPHRADSYQPKICNDWPRQEQQPVPVAAESPTWDEVFGDEEDDHQVRDDSKETDDEMSSKDKEIGEEAGKNMESLDDVRNDEMPDFTDGGVEDNRASQCSSHMDKSMDLFGDDTAFLQITIPDISTPGVTPRASPCAGDISNSTKETSNTSQVHNPMNPCSATHTADTTHRLNTVQTGQVAHANHITHTPHAELITQNATACNTTIHYAHTSAPSETVTYNSVTDKVIAAHCQSPNVQQKAESFDRSHDYFSVNFDLGYSLEDSEDEAEVEAAPAPCMLTSPQPKKQADSPVSLPALSNSSTPYNSFTRQRTPAQFSESKLSTPQMYSEHRKREMSSPLSSPLMSKCGALPSPIMSVGVRRMPVPRPAGPNTPPSLFSLKRTQPAGCTAEAERGSGAKKSCQESVCVSDSPHHYPGLFTLQKI